MSGSFCSALGVASVLAIGGYQLVEDEVRAEPGEGKGHSEGPERGAR
jgi:hypothetical protein